MMQWNNGSDRFLDVIFSTFPNRRNDAFQSSISTIPALHDLCSVHVRWRRRRRRRGRRQLLLGSSSQFLGSLEKESYVLSYDWIGGDPRENLFAFLHGLSFRWGFIPSCWCCWRRFFRQLPYVYDRIESNRLFRGCCSACRHCCCRCGRITHHPSHFFAEPVVVVVVVPPDNISWGGRPWQRQQRQHHHSLLCKHQCRQQRLPTAWSSSSSLVTWRWRRCCCCCAAHGWRRQPQAVVECSSFPAYHTQQQQRVNTTTTSRVVSFWFFCRRVSFFRWEKTKLWRRVSRLFCVSFSFHQEEQPNPFHITTNHFMSLLSPGMSDSEEYTRQRNKKWNHHQCIFPTKTHWWSVLGSVVATSKRLSVQEVNEFFGYRASCLWRSFIFAKQFSWVSSWSQQSRCPHVFALLKYFNNLIAYYSINTRWCNLNFIVID